MTRIWWRLCGLMVLSAVLQIAMFPIAGPLPWWRGTVSWVAFVPMLYVLVRSDELAKPLTIMRGAGLGYMCGLLWYGGSCYWIYRTMNLYGGLPKLVSFGVLALFALYLGLYHGLFAGLVVLLRCGGAGVGGALALAPALWVVVEFARSRITGFPWDLLGTAQVDNQAVSQLATLTGTMGISFLVVCGNAALVTFFTSIRRRRYSTSCGVAVIVCLVALGLPRAERASDTSATAVLMQDNLEVGAVGRENRPFSRDEELSLFSGWSLHPQSHEADKDSWRLANEYAHHDLVVWPEAPSNLESSDPEVRASLGEMARVAKSPVIAGTLGIDFTNAAERGYFLYDSASLFDNAGRYQGRYDKIHLVPWGEYVPFKRFFSFAQKLTEGVGDMDRGRERSVFRTGGHIYGVFICYESIFGDEVRQFVKSGAEVLVNISDDGWYGDTGAPWQHLNMARMRAIENHRWVLRSTNTGVTTAIDPYGRIAYEAPRHVRGAFMFPFGFEQEKTFYTRHGDWFAWVCVVVSAFGLGASHLRRMN